MFKGFMFFIRLLALIVCCVSATCLALSPPSTFCDVIPTEHSYSGTNKVAVGEYAQFYCNRGYRTIGRRRRKCMKSGELSGPPVVCEEITCPMPPIPVNGEQVLASHDPIRFLDKVSFTCKKCYTLIGRRKRLCMKRGVVIAPTCVNENNNSGYCTLPPLPSSVGYYSNITGDKLSIGETITYNCKPGHRMLVGEMADVTCNCDATLSGNPPLCVIDEIPNQSYVQSCDLPPLPANGFYTHHIDSTTSLSVGQSVTYACVERTSLVGEKTLTCKPDGNLSGDPPICIDSSSPLGGAVGTNVDGIVDPIVFCGAVTVPKNGQITNPMSQVTVGAVVHFKCNFGMRMFGSSTIECGEDGNYVGSPPKCIRPVLGGFADFGKK